MNCTGNIKQSNNHAKKKGSQIPPGFKTWEQLKRFNQIEITINRNTVGAEISFTRKDRTIHV